MTYHWSKNIVRDVQEAPKHYAYKGLIFPLFQEVRDSRSEPRYAFFGCKALTRAQIREHVHIMIDRGEYAQPV